MRTNTAAVYVRILKRFARRATNKTDLPGLLKPKRSVSLAKDIQSALMQVSNIACRRIGIRIPYLGVVYLPVRDSMLS